MQKTDTQIIMPEGQKDKTADYPVDKDGNKLKPCCACPETKRPRDECIMEKVTMRNIMGLMKTEICSPLLLTLTPLSCPFP